MDSFKLYLTTSGVQDPTRKGALLLHLAGTEVQVIFGKLEEKEVVVNTHTFFTPQKNIPYENHAFRQIEQAQGESADNYVSRLKTIAARCEFGENKDDVKRD